MSSTEIKFYTHWSNIPEPKWSDYNPGPDCSQEELESCVKRFSEDLVKHRNRKLDENGNFVICTVEDGGWINTDLSEINDYCREFMQEHPYIHESDIRIRINIKY